MEGGVLCGQAGMQPLYIKIVHVCICVSAQQEVDLINYLAVLYLHGVCFPRRGLPIGKDSPIVSTQYIYNERRRKHVRQQKVHLTAVSRVPVPGSNSPVT